MKPQVTTIERTSKRYKVASVLAQVLLVAGIMTTLSGTPGGWRWMLFVVGPTLIVLAFCSALYARIGAWWNNR